MQRSLIGLLAAAGLACQRTPDPFVAGSLSDAASIRLYAVADGADWSAHIPLFIGDTVRLQVRLFVADGREIVPRQHPVQMSFTFTPASLATATVADSVTLLEDVTPTDTAGAGGGLRVSLTEPATGTTKSFGPFDVLVH
jgi:hypothetical protein